MLSKFRQAFLFFLASYSIGASAQKKCSELVVDVKTEIQNGKVITLETPVDGKSLPQITVYSKVAGSAKDGMDLFSNFNSHKTIFPGLTESKIAARPTPLTWDVDYKMDMLIGSESYSMRNVLQPPDAKKTSFRLDWNSTKAQNMKESRGFVIFEQISDGFVCMTYSNLIDLGNIPGVSLLKGTQITKLNEAVEAFKKNLDNTVKSAAQN